MRCCGMNCMQYKTAPTEEQRGRLRQEYLDRRGVPASAGESLIGKVQGVSRS